MICIIFAPYLIKMKNYSIIAAALLLILASCTPTKEEDKGAENLYIEAEKCFSEGNYSRSKLLIDSIHSAYRRNVEVRKKASLLMTEITAAEQERNRQYADSIRPIRQAEFNALLKNFAVSPDTAYFDYKKYIHKSLLSKGPRINIIAEVKDDGELQLISVYMGRKLDHVKVKVSTKNNFFVESGSISLDSPYNNRFDDFGTRWEYLTITGENLNGLHTFIADNESKPLRVTLISDSVVNSKGVKKPDTYSYNLEPSDRKAIKQSVELSILAKDLKELGKILK